MPQAVALKTVSNGVLKQLLLLHVLSCLRLAEVASFSAVALLYLNRYSNCLAANSAGISGSR